MFTFLCCYICTLYFDFYFMYLRLEKLLSISKINILKYREKETSDLQNKTFKFFFKTDKCGYKQKTLHRKINLIKYSKTLCSHRLHD